MSELLPWLFLTDDQATVVNKDSSLMATFTFAGVDCEATNEHGIEDIANLFDRALRGAAEMPTRIWTRIDRIHAPNYPDSEFSNAMSKEIDDIWKQTFIKGTYTNLQTLSVAMATTRKERSIAELARDNLDAGMALPKALALAAKDAFQGGGKDAIGFDNQESLETARQRFEQNVIAPLTQTLHSLKMDRLTGDGLCGWLKFCTSTSQPHRVVHNPLSYLDAALSDTWIDNRHRDYLIFNGERIRYAAVLTLKAAPGANRMSALDALLALPLELTIGHCWIPQTKAKAVADLRKARTFDELSRLSIKSLFKRAATQPNEMFDVDDAPTTEVGRVAESHIGSIHDNDMAFGMLASTIVIYAESPVALERNVESVANNLAQSGLTFLREREGAVSGYSVTIPGNVIDPLRWFQTEAGNMTDVSPLITLDIGEISHPHFSGMFGTEYPAAALLRTRYNTAYHLNNHVGALGHTAIIGPSRNGKTMMQMFLESQLFKYPNARVINFDKDFSCEAMTLLHDGVTFDLTPGSLQGAKMNPLAGIKDPSTHIWIVSFIDRLMTYRGQRLNDREMEAVHNALKGLMNVPHTRLTTLSGQLNQDLQARLAPWCEGGVYGDYFDNTDDELDFADITTFELGALITRNELDLLRAFTDYVFYRVENELNRATDLAQIGPTLIYFEEAGFLLEDPRFSERAVDYLMTLAKKQAFLVMTAQSPEPFFRNERLKAAVRDNIATIIFLPNTGAPRGELATQYKVVFGVNDNHLALIAGAMPRREYCIWQPQKEHFRVAVAQLPKPIVNRLRSDKTSRAVLAATYSPTDNGWKREYLKQLDKLN